MSERVSGTAYDNLRRSLSPEGRTLVIVAAGDLESVLKTVENQRYEIARLKGNLNFFQEGPKPPEGLVRALHESMTAQAEEKPAA